MKWYTLEERRPEPNTKVLAKTTIAYELEYLIYEEYDGKPEWYIPANDDVITCETEIKFWTPIINIPE